jgi:hypothetical protein
MHGILSHGKFTAKELDVGELSWILGLYCLQHIAPFTLMDPSELDLLKKTLEDRYFRSRNNVTRMRSQLNFNPRSDILQKLTNMLIIEQRTTYNIMTLLF